MSVKQVRNKNYLPRVDGEGYFVDKKPPEPVTHQATDDPEKIELWARELSPCDRMFYHHTLSSTRRIAKFQNYE